MLHFWGRQGNNYNMHDEVPLMNFWELISTPMILDAPLVRAPSAACNNYGVRILSMLSFWNLFYIGKWACTKYVIWLLIFHLKWKNVFGARICIYLGANLELLLHLMQSFHRASHWLVLVKYTGNGSYYEIRRVWMNTLSKDTKKKRTEAGIQLWGDLMKNQITFQEEVNISIILKSTSKNLQVKVIITTTKFFRSQRRNSLH